MLPNNRSRTRRNDLLLRPVVHPMKITIRSAQLNAQEIDVSGLLQIHEVRLTGASISLSPDPGGRLVIGEATGTVTVTEAALNRVLADATIDKVRGLDLKTYSGRIGISGRHEVLGPVSLPFNLSAVPEIEGGVRLRLSPKEISVAGGVGVPAFLVQAIGTKINEQLAKRFDASKLPIPLRLTGVTVEPGRLILSAALLEPASEPLLTEE
jgi:hypothetical protein